ncbi:uncharacterized protein J8A68_004397 [[Candida] subhashii]|uniref:Uncharacterized protein n=1 Tax=[Candida] subhashii TaxID=561895 RepID=A0A8J5UVB4_9ASCO|nr:uncharacterized protein J8A68_004397 [[Candida] subhashii]KAG7662135.1 hypothetical protein J8A68_004397 [[Candida] subhashii]
MDQQWNEQLSYSTRKRQRRRFEIFHLPIEVIELIISFIPDDCLETYVDIPFLGEHAINKLYRFIEIVWSQSTYSEGTYYTPNAFSSIAIPKLDDGTSLSNLLNEVDACGGSYKQLKVNQFVQLRKKYNTFKPKIVYFKDYMQFVWFHERYPDILRQLPRIDFSYGQGYKLPPSLFDPSYKVFRLSTKFGGGCRHPDVANEHRFHTLLSSISSLTAYFFPWFTDESWRETWGVNLQDLELNKADSDQLPRLFPNLRKLRLTDKINLFQTRFPRLPSKLQFLQIYISELDELDVSYLENLREFVADIGCGFDELSKFKFPLGIESVILWGMELSSRNSLETAHSSPYRLESLDSIELYTNLKELRIGHGNISLKTTAFSNISLPSSLKTLEILLFDFIKQRGSAGPRVTFDESFQIPNNLRVLNLDVFQGLYQPEKLTFPDSLRVLKISNNGLQDAWDESVPEENWSSARFPDSLIELKLHVPKVDGVVLPKSLRSLDLYSFSPISSISFLDLNELVQLSVAWKGMEEFVYKLPSSLRTLDLSDNYDLDTIIIHAPNLKRVELANTKFEKIERLNFQLPDCVESLSVMPRGLDPIEPGDALDIMEPNVLPKQLKELYLTKYYITAKLLGEMKLDSYKNLVKLDLSGNKIRFLERSFPLSLRCLILDGNPISTLSDPNVLSELSNLQEIRMSETKINQYLQSEGMTLKFPPSLKILNLSDNKLEAGVAANIILSNCCELQELFLNRNPNMTDVQIIIDTVKSSSPDMVEMLLDYHVKEHVNEEGAKFVTFR